MAVNDSNIREKNLAIKSFIVLSSSQDFSGRGLYFSIKAGDTVSVVRVFLR